MPQLSIIIINLDNAIRLQKTIESVVKQTSQDFEYIVIDGGSTDGSVEVIKRYAAKITYGISKPDKGIKLAQGTYCQFLNSGDCLAKEDTTEIMLKNIPNTSILIGNMLKILPNGKILTDRGIQNEQAAFLTFYRGTLNHSSACMRRNLFNKYGYYDEELKIVSDWK